MSMNNPLSRKELTTMYIWFGIFLLTLLAYSWLIGWLIWKAQ